MHSMLPLCARHSSALNPVPCPRARTHAGVEMEALTAAAVAALTVYDMCKAVSKSIVVSELQLDFKAGGKGGTYQRGGAAPAS